MTTDYTRTLNIDEPLAYERSDGTVRYYVADALGSVVALTDDQGLVTTTYQYDAFGNTTINGSDYNPFQYTGRENDGTGLYYYRARYYSPGMRRFISEDPIRLLGGANYYGYVGSSPLNWIDPWGLMEMNGRVAVPGPGEDCPPDVPCMDPGPLPTPNELPIRGFPNGGLEPIGENPVWDFGAWQAVGEGVKTGLKNLKDREELKKKLDDLDKQDKVKPKRGNDGGSGGGGGCRKNMFTP